MTLFGGAITISGITFMLLTVLVVIVAGYIIGRISIKEVSIGTAGVFVAALIFGALFNDTIHNALTLDGGDLTNTAFYLYTNQSWWGMTPDYFKMTAYRKYLPYGSILYDEGQASYATTDSKNGLRPSVSLAPTSTITQGDGTATNPYVVE